VISPLPDHVLKWIVVGLAIFIFVFSIYIFVF